MGHAHAKRLFLNHLHKPLGVLGSTLGSSGYGHKLQHGQNAWAIASTPRVSLHMVDRDPIFFGQTVSGWREVKDLHKTLFLVDFSGLFLYSRLLHIRTVGRRSSLSLSTLASAFHLSHLKCLFIVPFTDDRQQASGSPRSRFQPRRT